MSPYFPPLEEARGLRYWCPNCRAHYRVLSPNVSCLVMHPPGDCCHFGEERADAPAPERPTSPTPNSEVHSGTQDSDRGPRP